MPGPSVTLSNRSYATVSRAPPRYSIPNPQLLRRSCRNRRRQVPYDEWIRVPGAFVAAVDKRLFTAVQTKLARSRRRPTRDEIIDGMRKVISRAGRINQKLLKHYRRASSTEQMAHEFRSLNEAYKVIGYGPNLDPEHSENRGGERNMERLVAEA
jgi:hypothetical protein